MNKTTFPLDESIPLPRSGTWPESFHLFERQSVEAINAALAARRPLLIRGEPGTGKSQLARAAACRLKRLFVAHVVNGRSESEDLHYYFDAVGRLGEAQAAGAVCQTQEQVDEKLDVHRFLTPGPLWWVFDWKTAAKQHARSAHQRLKPMPPTGWESVDGTVLLIDEIDKADADLPNGLLETLGNGAFPVPWVNETIGLVHEKNPPLVMITTNEERELPPAFVRRCMVLHLKLPDEVEEFTEKLSQRGVAHFGEAIHEAVRLEAAKQLWQDRQQAKAQGVSPAGQAEYLDMLRALDEMGKEGLGGLSGNALKNAQLELLGRIAPYALGKFV